MKETDKLTREVIGTLEFDRRNCVSMPSAALSKKEKAVLTTRCNGQGAK